MGDSRNAILELGFNLINRLKLDNVIYCMVCLKFKQTYNIFKQVFHKLINLTMRKKVIDSMFQKKLFNVTLTM